MKKTTKILLAIALATHILCGCESTYRTDLLDVNSDLYPGDANDSYFNASKSGNLPAVEKALKKKANINAADRLGQSALMWACWNGHSKVVDFIISHDEEQLQKRSKKYEPLDFSAESSESYNALFCLMMSSAMSTSDSLKAQKTLLQKSPDLLDKRDSYGETVLHKAVRSENVACLDAVLTMLHKNGRLAAVMETRNKPFGETPLLVAVKMQNLDMVRRLLKKGADIFAKDAFGKSASVLAMDKGRGNFDVFLEIMKAMLRRGKTEDPDLEAEIEETQKITKSPIEEAFRKIYKDIKEKKIKNPDKLDAREYRRYVVEFLDLVSKKRDTLKQQDIKRVRQLLKEAPGLICSKMDDSYSGKKKSAIQLCIENNGNPALFSILIDTVPQQSVVRVSRGLGDYMICAVRNIRPEIIELLLAKSYGGFVPSWIMGTGNYLSPTESIDGKTSNPVAQFIKTPALWKASEDGTLTRLAKPLLSYYSSQYTNGNYASSILEAALEQENSEKLLLLLYKYKGFSAVHKIGDKPLESIMLEKKYMKALQTSIEMGMLDKQWVTADTNRIESFQNLLESRSDDTASKEIIEILKKHGIYREKTADDAK